MKISDESGRSINVRELGKEGPAVVLIHGWMMSSAVFDPLCDALAAHARVFAVDLRGAGGSDRADRYELEDYAADVAAVLDRVGCATLIGHSMGGAIAQLVAASQPQRVDKLILLNPVPAGGMPLPEDAMALFHASAGDREKQGVILDLACVRLEGSAKDRLLEIASTVDADAIRASLLAWTSGGFEDRLAHIRAETHVITTSDPFLPPAFLQQSIVDHVEGASLHVLEGPGHYPMWEAAAETAELLNGLLAERN